MSRVQDGAKQDDLLYDHFTEKDDFWFDFMADTGDGGNPSYAVARLLAQPLIRVRSSDSVFTLPRADLLLIGGDLAYAFTLYHCLNVISYLVLFYGIYIYSVGDHLVNL